MAARCETIGKYALPLFRAIVAKELVNNYHLTQVEAARRLGTTQAAISQYITSKRAAKGSKLFAAEMPKIQSMAAETAKRIAEEKVNWNEVTLDFCRLCSTLFEESNETANSYVI